MFGDLFLLIISGKKKSRSNLMMEKLSRSCAILNVDAR